MSKTAHTPDKHILAQPYRDAMSAVASGVHLITTDGSAGRCGITMTAVTSVTDDPPTMILCINRGAHIQSVLRENKNLCVNVLAAHQQDVAERFAGLTDCPPAERFSHNEWLADRNGQPRLQGALAHFVGHISDSRDIGSHTVFVVAVDHIDTADSRDAALLYHRRAFGQHPQP